MKEQITKLRSQGFTYNQIAKSLDISKATIFYHIGKDGKEKNFRRRNINRKANMIKFKTEAGGKCQCCGYDKCFHALDFHHIDPTTKDRIYEGIMHMLNNCSLKKAREEMKKCILLCSNCHREVHAGVRTLPQIAAKAGFEPTVCEGTPN